MNTGSPKEDSSLPDSMSARFASMILQQTNMALMLLGRMPHPESGENHTDIEAARMFIDQLEMLEHKTRGNLEPQEDKLLRQSLTTLRMAFVEAVSGEAEPGESQTAESTPGTTTSHTPESGEATGTPSDPESRKKFVKKY